MFLVEKLNDLQWMLEKVNDTTRSGDMKINVSLIDKVNFGFDKENGMRNCKLYIHNEKLEWVHDLV